MRREKDDEAAERRDGSLRGQRDSTDSGACGYGSAELVVIKDFRKDSNSRLEFAAQGVPPIILHEYQNTGLTKIAFRK